MIRRPPRSTLSSSSAASDVYRDRYCRARKSGFQAVRTLNRKPETLTIPFITISNNEQKTDKMWCTRQGEKDYQAKPETENELMVSIDGALC